MNFAKDLYCKSDATVKSTPGSHLEIPSDSKFKSYLKTYYYQDEKNCSSLRTKQNKYVKGKTQESTPEKETIRHQVVFVMDVTASMGPYIVGTKEQVHKFIDNLRQDTQKEIENNFSEKKDSLEYIFEVAIVAYRDFNDTVHFETLDFTTDLGQVKEFLNLLSASGGNDNPEDVEGALIHALFGINEETRKLSWEERGPTASRTMIWLADAPPHGSYINGTSHGDEFPLTDENEWQEIGKKLAELKIAFMSAKLTSNTIAADKTLSALFSSLGVNYSTIDISESVNARGHHFESDGAYTTVTKYVSDYVTRSTSHYVSSSLLNK